MAGAPKHVLLSIHRPRATRGERISSLGWWLLRPYGRRTAVARLREDQIRRQLELATRQPAA